MRGTGAVSTKNLVKTNGLHRSPFRHVLDPINTLGTFLFTWDLFSFHIGLKTVPHTSFRGVDSIYGLEYVSLYWMLLQKAYWKHRIFNFSEVGRNHLYSSTRSQIPSWLAFSQCLLHRHVMQQIRAQVVASLHLTPKTRTTLNQVQLLPSAARQVRQDGGGWILPQPVSHVSRHVWYRSAFSENRAFNISECKIFWETFVMILSLPFVMNEPFGLADRSYLPIQTKMGIAAFREIIGNRILDAKM